MKSNRAVVISSAVAHGLAWAAFLWLVFWPYSYQGTRATPIGPDGSGGEVVSVSASMIEINGPGVLIPLLVPVALTAIGLLNVLTWDGRNSRSSILLWVSVVLLIVFCVLAMFSIGMFYLPAALTLLVSAVIMSGRTRPKLAKDE